MSDKAAMVWECGHTQDGCKRLYSIKGLPDSSVGLSLNTVILQHFEHVYDSNSSSNNQDMSSSKSVNVLYCLAGHKISAGKLPVVKTNSYSKEVLLLIRFVGCIHVSKS